MLSCKPAAGSRPTVRQVAAIRLHGIVQKRSTNITGIARSFGSAAAYRWQQLLQSHGEEVALQLNAIDEFLDQ